MFGRLALALAEHEGTLLSMMVFGNVSAHTEAMQAMEAALGVPVWPVTWVEGASCEGAPLAGVQAFAVAGAEVQRLVLGGRVLGSIYDDGAARHCLLGGLGPTAVAGMERPAQVQQMFAALESALDLAG
ncbi:MAG TPA: hypothetical protein VGD81_03475, partial [Opitutaceae bacterium]